MKKTLIQIAIALLAVGLLFGGLLWWLNSKESTETDKDCVYLSELNEDELWELFEKKIEDKLGPP
ncbi:MAG: hypothetical protein F4219_02025 [Gammaproteobacteria bacterium]|nr:hypothetical protein [Gammaproteobacteria bacterium]